MEYEAVHKVLGEGPDEQTRDAEHGHAADTEPLHRERPP
jgi:hypothetical protein